MQNMKYFVDIFWRGWELRVDRWRDSNLVPEDQQQLDRKVIYKQFFLGSFYTFYTQENAFWKIVPVYKTLQVEMIYIVISRAAPWLDNVNAREQDQEKKNFLSFIKSSLPG